MNIAISDITFLTTLVNAANQLRILVSSCDIAHCQKQLLENLKTFKGSLGIVMIDKFVHRHKFFLSHQIAY